MLVVVGLCALSLEELYGWYDGDSFCAVSLRRRKG